MVNNTTSRRLNLQNFDVSPTLRQAQGKPSGRFWAVTLERLSRLEGVMLDEISELKKMMKAE